MKRDAPVLSPGRAVLWAAGMILFFGWLAGELAPNGDPGFDPAELDSWADVDRRLRRAVADPHSRVVLVIGDSVVAGDTLATHQPEHAEFSRIVPLLEDAKARDADVSFHELSSAGMLPADIARLLERLREWDPGARIEPLIELNLRYFSRTYADSSPPSSLPFLRDPRSPSVKLGWLPDTDAWARHLANHRAGFAGLRGRFLRTTEALPCSLLTARRDPDSEAAASHLLRVRPNFLDLTFDESSVQVQALRQLVAELDEEERRSWFFLTPINEDLLVEAEEVGVLYELTARVGQQVDTSETISLANLNHESFGPERFLDHCHLTADGNQALAGWLLRELGVAGRHELAAVDRGFLTPSEPQHLVGGGQLGYRNGLGSQVRFDAPEDLAITTAGDLIIADTGNHVLRKVRVDRRTCELFAGSPGEPGWRDGEPSEALFHTPARVAPAPDGGIYVLDRGTGAIRHVDEAGVARGVAPYDRPCREFEGVGAETKTGHAARIDSLDLDLGCPLDIASRGDDIFVLEDRDSSVRVLARGELSPRLLLTGATETISIDVDGQGTLWLLDATGTVRLATADFLSGFEGPPQVSELPVAISTGMDPEEMASLDPGKCVGELVAPTRIVADPAAQRAVALDAPWAWVLYAGADCAQWLVHWHRDRRPTPPVPIASALAVDAGTGDLYWLAQDRSYLVRWPARPLDQSDRYRTSTAVQPGSSRYRIAVYGSSLPGLGYGFHPSVADSRGLPAELEVALSLQPGLDGVDVAVHGRCGQATRVITSVLELMKEPPGSADMALFVVDKASLESLAEHYLTTDWTQDGLPVDPGAPFVVGHALLSEDLEVDATTALRAVLGAIATWCDRQGIEPVLVDVLALDDDDYVGLRHVAAWLHGDELRTVAAELGIPLLEPADHVIPRLPGSAPIVHWRDHHFTLTGHQIQAEYLAHHLTRLIHEDIRHSGEGDSGGGAPPSPTTGGAVHRPLKPLPDDITATWGAPADRLATFRDGSRLGVVVDVTAEPGPAAPDAPASGSPDLWQRAAWVAARYSERATDGMSIALVSFPSRNEYGRIDHDRPLVHARFEVSADDVERAASEAVTILREERPAQPPWLVDVTAGDGE